MKRKNFIFLTSAILAILSLGFSSCRREDSNLDPESQAILNEEPAQNSVDYRSGTPIPLAFLNSEKEFQDFVAANPIAVVKFGATWCGPCRALSPELEKMAGFFADKGVKFVEIDVDEMSDFSQKQNVSGIPDVRVYLEGREYGKIVGLDAYSLANLISSVCPNDSATNANSKNAAQTSEKTIETETPSVDKINDEAFEKEIWPEDE